ncbi:MAG: RES family NAD+ phosphorylase [Planctomycetaceae bacterium]
MLTPHSDRDRFVRRIGNMRPTAVSFQGVIVRSTTPKYATETDLVTGEGSRRYGGRWNPIGVAAVYGSLTPETAMAETLAHHRYFQLPIEAVMPRTFVAIEARLRRVLDLTDGAVRQRLRVSERRLTSTDWRRDNDAGREALTQAIGFAAFTTGFEAILAPSAQDETGTGNLIIFPGNLLKSSRVEVRNPAGLQTPAG